MMGLNRLDPDEKYAYSNLGYLVVGRVMEMVTGQKYEPWTKANVLKPARVAGMYLGKGLPERRPKGEVRYYDSKKRMGPCLYPPKVGQQVPLPDGAGNIEGYEAHGGWVASAIDLVRFASALDYGKKSPLLSKESINEMWARPAGAAGFDAKDKPKASYYACGWDVRPVGNAGKATAWHTGLIPGTSTLLVRRWDGLNWAVLFQRGQRGRKGALRAIDSPMHRRGRGEEVGREPTCSTSSPRSSTPPHIPGIIPPRAYRAIGAPHAALHVVSTRPTTPTPNPADTSRVAPGAERVLPDHSASTAEETTRVGPCSGTARRGRGPRTLGDDVVED